MTVTQNIDGLHHAAGSRNVLECHGSYRSARCLGCGKKYPLEGYLPVVQEGGIPRCLCGGMVKPDVVFFGEALPEEFYSILSHPPRADLLLVLGTSLSVQPAASLVLTLAGKVPSIIINRDGTEYDYLFSHVIHKDLEETAHLIDRSLRGE